MPRVRVHNLAMSLDGFVAGADQALGDPLGVGGTQLHEWVFVDRDPVDDSFLTRGDEGVGATIMGRNMFGPIRGDWSANGWTGWWGDEPPYHHPVFVLTHHARDPIEMQGGTTFRFVTGGIEAALDLAITAADGRDVRIGGGASTVRQYLRAGLVDELHVAVVPVFLGAGERLFDELDGAMDAYDCVEQVSSPAVSHFRFVRR